MKSGRKIWSIPIAALALVLMLAGALVVTSIVQAQATGTKTVTGGGTVYHDAASLTAGDTGSPLASISIQEGDAAAVPDATPPTPAINGLNLRAEGPPVVTAEGISGFDLAGTDKDYFSIIGDTADPPNGEVRVKDPESLTYIQDHTKKAIFNVDVLVYVDRDIATDSGRGFRPEGSTPDSPSGDDTDAEDKADDRDEVNRVSVRIHAIKWDDSEDGLLFATIPAEANPGDRVLGPNGEMKVVTVYGLPARAKLTVSDPAGYDAIADGHEIYLNFADTYDPVAASTDRTFAATIETAVAHITGNTDDDEAGRVDDVALSDVDAVIDQFAPLDFDRATAGLTPDPMDKGTADNPYSFSVRNNAEASTQIGVISIGGARASEAGANNEEVIDVIVTGNSMFTAEPRKVALAYTQVIVRVAGDLSDAMGPHTFTLTINGRASLGRTAVATVKVNVTASNSEPEVSGTDADGKLVIAVTESSKTSTDLVDIMTGPQDNRVATVIHDLAGNVEDDTPDSALRYELVGKFLPFMMSGSKLVISTGETGGLLANVEKDPAVKDDVLTTTVDETKAAVYRRQGTDEGVLVDENNQYSDVTYTFAVRVSDPANTVEIPVTLTVDVNEPTTAKLTGLPTGVTVEDVAVDDDGDVATDAKVMKTYKFSTTVTERDVPLVVLDLRTLVNDSDVGDSIDFDDVEGEGAQKLVVYGDRPSHFVTGRRRPSADIHASVTDDGCPYGYVAVHAVCGGHIRQLGEQYCYAEGPDTNLRLELTITEEPPAPITSNFVSIEVEENSTDCSQTGIASGCSVAGVVAGAVSYSIESGVDGGDTDYEVDASTGEITVKVAPNFEDGKSPAFLVNAKNDLDELAGLISVRVAITDEPEAPTLTAITGVPWVYETAQIGDHVVEKPADQDGPAATDLAISISASDPDAGATITYSISEGKPPFAVHASTGALTVSGALDTEAAGSHTFKVKATDEGGLSDEMEITVDGVEL